MKNKALIYLIIVLVIVGAAGYWYYQQRVFSKEILKLEIFGPETAKVGEIIEYTLRYKNNGNFTLENAKLIFEFPEDSLPQNEKTRVARNLEDVYPGEEQILRFKTRLFGKESELKTTKASVSYNPKNLNASYESSTTFTTKIDFVPLTLEFDLPSKVESDREIQFSLNYFSNLDYPLTDLKLEVEYPQEFQFLESKPTALEKTEWPISLLKKAEGGRIKIKGKIGKSVGLEQEFKARLGVWQEDRVVWLKEAGKKTEIIKPLLYLSQQINGSTSYIASPGEKLRYEIFFKNIGSTPFENQFLIVRLDGLAFDLATLKADLGEFKADDNLIIWDWKRVPELRSLDVQEEGRVEFEIKLKDSWAASEGEKNTVIKNKVNIGQLSEEFQIKVNSKLEILQKALFQDEAFGNSGPMPPRAENTTTYTVSWEIRNYHNDVKNVKVKAVLPSGAELTGRIFPENESAKFSFDPQSREIVWILSDNQAIEAGAGLSKPGRSVYFQVALRPNSSQKGKVIPIIKEAKIEGEDLWTNSLIKSQDQLIDTNLPDDPVYSGKGIVE